MGSGEQPLMSLCAASPDIGYLKTGFGFLNASLENNCFVENNSKTTARVVAVCEICMSTAAIN